MGNPDWVGEVGLGNRAGLLQSPPQAAAAAARDSGKGTSVVSATTSDAPIPSVISSVPTLSVSVTATGAQFEHEHISCTCSGRNEDFSPHSNCLMICGTILFSDERKGYNPLLRKGFKCPRVLGGITISHGSCGPFQLGYHTPPLTQHRVITPIENQTKIILFRVPPVTLCPLSSSLGSW